MATSWIAGRAERITIVCHFLDRRHKFWITILAMQVLLHPKTASISLPFDSLLFGILLTLTFHALIILELNIYYLSIEI